MPIKLPTFTPVVVANRYHLKGAELAASISVQRPGPLGNRWRAKDVGLGPALSLYRAWLDQEYHTRGGPAYQELMRLAWIEPLVITCTCLPRSLQLGLGGRSIHHFSASLDEVGRLKLALGRVSPPGTEYNIICEITLGGIDTVNAQCEGVSAFYDSVGNVEWISSVKTQAFLLFPHFKQDLAGDGSTSPSLLVSKSESPSKLIELIDKRFFYYTFPIALLPVIVHAFRAFESMSLRLTSRSLLTRDAYSLTHRKHPKIKLLCFCSDGYDIYSNLSGDGFTSPVRVEFDDKIDQFGPFLPEAVGKSLFPRGENPVISFLGGFHLSNVSGSGEGVYCFMFQEGVPCHAQIVAEYIERLRKELATLHAALPADGDGF